MYGKTAIVLLSSLLFACAQAPPPPPPPAAAAEPAAAPPAQQVQEDRFVAIRRAPCERVLQLPNEDRAAAAMFYMGYQASRSGATAINVPKIPSLVSLAVSYCKAYPSRPAAEAFAYAYSVTGR